MVGAQVRPGPVPHRFERLPETVPFVSQPWCAAAGVQSAQVTRRIGFEPRVSGVADPSRTVRASGRPPTWQSEVPPSYDSLAASSITKNAVIFASLPFESNVENVLRRAVVKV